VSHFIDGNLIAFDTETTGLSAYHGDRPFAFSFCNEQGETAYFEFEVDVHTRQPIVKPRVVERIRDLISDSSITKIGHNLKFDVRMLELAHGIRLAGPIHETMFMSHVCNAAERSHQLKPLSEHYLGVSRNDEAGLIAAVKSCRRAANKLGWKINTSRKGVDKDSSAMKADYWLPGAFWKRREDRGAAGDAARELVAKYPNLGSLCRTYAILDAERTMLLHLLYKDVIEKEDLGEVYERERRLWPIVYAMESRGVKIDLERTKAEAAICTQVIAKNRKIIVDNFGEFKKKIPDQRIRDYLFGKEKGQLGLTPRKGELTDKTKQPQVGKAVLSRLTEKYPPLAAITEYARHLKAKSTYFDNYTGLHVDQIIHCNYVQCGPISGRFSCRSPNLTNVPKRAPKGDVMKRVRAPFGPREGYVWLHYDFEGIEPHILAEESGCPDMIAVFNSGGDVYVELMDRVVDTVVSFVRRVTGDPSKFTKEHRHAAAFFLPILKRGMGFLEEIFAENGGARQVGKINFLGWTYGEGTTKLSKAMGLPLELAELIVNALRTAFPRIPEYMKEMQRKAKVDGFIRTRYGRKVPIPPPARIKDEDTGEIRWIEFWYKAVNYVIQPTAADVLKEAMIRLHQLLQKSQRDAHMVMCIHDEIVVEILREDADREFVDLMGACIADHGGRFKLVDTPVDVKVTVASWDEPQDIEVLWKEGVDAQV
jgi:DNA polymerase-1